MKKLSKCKRLLCLTLSMISLFAILAVPQASAEAVSYPNEGLEGQAIGGVQPLAYLISGTGVDFFNDKRFSGGSLTFTVYTETLEPVKKLGVVVSSCRDSMTMNLYGKIISSSMTIFPMTPTGSPSPKRTSAF